DLVWAAMWSPADPPNSPRSFRIRATHGTAHGRERGRSMSAHERTAAFLQLADEELTAARNLSGTNRRQAAYFCQQAAEKIARAILNEAGVPFGTGHNLSQMAFALPADHPWREKLNALDKHSPAATRYRYPSPT